jgi:hypothetical protein
MPASLGTIVQRISAESTVRIHCGFLAPVSRNSGTTKSSAPGTSACEDAAVPNIRAMSREDVAAAELCCVRRSDPNNHGPMSATISWDDLAKVDVRVGRIIDVQEFPEARRPAWRLRTPMRSGACRPW